ncbi:hypothetical protein GASC598I20_002160, partial [Gilliamella apicola SCGC AB-598-I20]
LLQFITAICMAIVSIFDLGFIFLVACIAGYIGCISTIGGNCMAVILDYYSHIAGTASSLTGTLRFAVAGAIGVLLSALVSTHTTTTVTSYLTEWLMVGSMVICNFLAAGLFLSVKNIKRK